MEKAYANTNRCKGCGYCTFFCGQGALSLSGPLNEKGYITVAVDKAKCVGCGVCYRVCPDYVFEVR